MSLQKLAIIAAALALISTAAYADCQCACVNGEVRALCSSSMDFVPLCPLRACPLPPASHEPVNPPRLPPLGTKRCYQRQVWDEQRLRYVWRQVCS
jgi:hypothetical protein